VPSDRLIIEKSDLHCRKELNEILDAQAKQEQETMERQNAMQEQQLETTTEGILAKAKADQSLAMERMNKIHLDEAISAERIQKAQEESSAQMLNFAKMLKELEGIDMEHMLRKVETLRNLTELELAHKQHDHEVTKHQDDMSLQHRQLDMQQQQQMQPQESVVQQ